MSREGLEEEREKSEMTLSAFAGAAVHIECKKRERRLQKLRLRLLSV